MCTFLFLEFVLSVPLCGRKTHFLRAGIIQKEETSMEKEIAGHRRGHFNLADAMYFSKKGCEAVSEDEVTWRFYSEELVSWNLLSRTNANLHNVSWQLTIVWVFGILIRYCLLLPFRWARCNLLGSVFHVTFYKNCAIICYWLAQKGEPGVTFFPICHWNSNILKRKIVLNRYISHVAYVLLLWNVLIWF